MSARVHLAVDLMSGDEGLRVNLPASLESLRADDGLHLHLVGDSQAIETAMDGPLPARASTVHAPDIIPMDAKPSAVLRQQDRSSLRVALQLLAEKQVEGVVSAGNTGALVALARQQLSMLEGFSRPAFCSALPQREGFSYLLDLGANVDCSAGNLHDFAALGSALASVLHAEPNPRVALLSNGREETKGNRVIRKARELLESDPQLNFVGFVEGDDLFDNLAQVIVCDGLLGNVALKSMEGAARLLETRLEECLQATTPPKILTMLSKSALGDLRREMNPESHNGAFLLGLQGVVVKSHGASSERSFRVALQQGAHCVKHAMVPQMERYLNKNTRNREDT